MNKILFFIKKLLIKILSHFTNPIQSIKLDIRSILFIYSKYVILKKHKINLKINKYLFEPDYLDLLNLINLMRKLKPKYVLELGGGYSTLALSYSAMLLKKELNIDCLVISIDQSKKYLEINKSIIPKNLAPFVKFEYRELEVVEFKGHKVSVFKNLPNYDYGLLYEDRHDHEETKIAGDAIFLEKKTNSMSICVDGMQATTLFYKNYLEKKYRISNSFLHGTNIIIKKN